VDGTRPVHNLLSPLAIQKDIAIISSTDQTYTTKDTIQSPPKVPGKQITNIISYHITKSDLVTGGRNRFLRAVFEDAKREHEMRMHHQRLPSDIYNVNENEGSSIRFSVFRCQSSRAGKYTIYIYTCINLYLYFIRYI
jgi:hypothetical protein